jgi:energy-coupling factor transport system ATP-binding protein
MTAILWENASVYSGDSTLSTVDAALAAGEICLVAGRTGSGKSTLLGTVNGAVPVSGRVSTLGRDTATHPPRRLSDVVAVLPARTADRFLAATVEDEVGAGLARFGLGAQARSRRIDELLASFGVAELRTRPLATLSAGQQRRVALAATIATEPGILVADEPTADLDSAGVQAVGERLRALASGRGATVLLADPRAERLLDRVDGVLLLPGANEPAVYGDPRALLTAPEVAPPLMALSELLRWDPPAITVAEALTAALTHPLPEPAADAGATEQPRVPEPSDEVVCQARGITVRNGAVPGLRDLDFTATAGEIVVLAGPNGSGKTTLLQTLAGLRRPDRGTVEVAGASPARLHGLERVRAVGLVPADPAELLLTDRVDRECAAADEEADVPPGRTAFVLDALLPGISPVRHTRALSTGERQALAMAIVLARGPRVILADEPTHGLDYAAKRRLATMLRRLAIEGHTVVVATHDPELTATLASRIVTLADGAVSGDCSVTDALLHGLVNTQVGQVMAPAPLYTVEDVRRELTSS